jgi:hypothetical protein
VLDHCIYILCEEFVPYPSVADLQRVCAGLTK